MAILGSDDFNRANGGLGVDWSTLVGGVAGDLDLASNKVGTEGGPNGQYYNATIGPADGYVQCVAVDVETNASQGMGLVYRHTGSGYYVVIFNTSLFEFASWDPTNGYIVLDTINTGFADGDICKVTFNGSAHEVFKNGISIGTKTDATFTAAGYCGIWSMDSDGSSNVDDFEFGTLDTVTLVTAFQPDAFQHNAFQVMGGTDVGAAGTWKTALGTAEGSVKSVLGLANASIKTIDGLTNG